MFLNQTLRLQAHLTPTERHEENAVIEARCSTLEAELRKSKRREEKLQVGI